MQAAAAQDLLIQPGSAVTHSPPDKLAETAAAAVKAQTNAPATDPEQRTHDAKLPRQMQTPAEGKASISSEQPAATLRMLDQQQGVQTPSTASAAAGDLPRTSAKSGKTAWLGRAGGLLGRWTVPVKVKQKPNSVDRQAVWVKKEPASIGKHGVTDTIDLT